METNTPRQTPLMKAIDRLKAKKALLFTEQQNHKSSKDWYHSLGEQVNRMSESVRVLESLLAEEQSEYIKFANETLHDPEDKFNIQFTTLRFQSTYKQTQ